MPKKYGSLTGMNLLVNARPGYLPAAEIAGQPPSMKNALAAAFVDNTHLCLVLSLSARDNYFGYKICEPPAADHPLAQDMIDMKDTDKVTTAFDMLCGEGGCALFLLSREIFAVMNAVNMFDALDATIGSHHANQRPADPSMTVSLQ